MEFDRHASAGYLANHMARLFARALQARIAPLGLSTGTFPVLLELWDSDGQAQKSLVEKLDIEQATLANTLARMERDGLVLRVRDRDDGRRQVVRLTERARALREPALGAAAGVNDLALGALSAEEEGRFIESMGRVIAALRDARAAAGPEVPAEPDGGRSAPCSGATTARGGQEG